MSFVFLCLAFKIRFVVSFFFRFEIIFVVVVVAAAAVAAGLNLLFVVL